MPVAKDRLFPTPEQVVAQRANQQPEPISRLAKLQQKKEERLKANPIRASLREVDHDPYGDEQPQTTGNREKPFQEESAQ